jgi:hypothetical protein
MALRCGTTAILPAILRLNLDFSKIALTSSLATERYSCMAALRFESASSSVFPCAAARQSGTRNPIALFRSD